MNQKALDGRTAVVTGASRGIGKAIAERFAAEGARLVLVGRHAASLESVAAGLDGATYVVGDVGDPATAASALEAAGTCDVLVNNAGMFPAGLLADLPPDAAEAIMRTNFAGTFQFCRAFVPAMVANGSGTVINVTSIAARAPTPGLSLYAASKGAVEAFSRAIAAEAAPNVRINCLSPGPTLTESVSEMAATDTTGAVAEVVGSIAMKRYADPAEIAAAALFLAGDGASFITGQTLQANGGSLMA